MMANIDPEEIAKFTTMANAWWNPTGDCKALHEINPLRLAYIQQQLNLKNQQCLDVGCGGGILTESLATAGAIVTGIDAATKAIEIAIAHQQKTNMQIHYLCTTAEEMAKQSPDFFDMVTCMELLEHVPDPTAIVSACATLVKPGGHLFFSTINRTLKAYLFAILGAEYILHLLPRNTHDYKKFIRPSELEAWGRATGLTLEDIKGIEYRPLTKMHRLTSDISINYIMHWVKNK